VGTVAEAAFTFLTHVRANVVPVSFLALLENAMLLVGFQFLLDKLAILFQ
jgi:hypothetical protein